MSSVLIGVFDNSSQARVAHAKIAAAGIDPSAMNMSGGEATAAALPGDEKRATDDKPGALSRFFADLFGTNDDAATYTEAVKRGHVVLSVTVADDDRADQVSEIMENCGAVDIDERAEQWSVSGTGAQHSLLPDEEVGPTGGRYAGAERRFNSGEGYVGRERRVGP